MKVEICVTGGGGGGVARSDARGAVLVLDFHRQGHNMRHHRRVEKLNHRLKAMTK